MSEVGFPVLDATVQKTNHLLKHIEGAYGWPKERRNQSYAALRSVLQTLRERLTVEETAQFAAQLPMLVRGLYYEANRCCVRTSHSTTPMPQTRGFAVAVAGVGSR